LEAAADARPLRRKLLRLARILGCGGKGCAWLTGRVLAAGILRREAMGPGFRGCWSAHDKTLPWKARRPHSYEHYFARLYAGANNQTAFRMTG
jgi:hypothetical protein